jgi:copper chaperone
MIAFEVKDMTCGHCVGTITKAVKAADQDATVQIDLAAHMVTIDPAAADAATLGAAIREAGYTPVAVDATSPSQPAAPAAKRGGCCCS